MRHSKGGNNAFNKRVVGRLEKTLSSTDKVTRSVVLAVGGRD